MRSLTTGARDRTRFDRALRNLEFDDAIPEGFLDVIQSFLTAVDYEDRTLMIAHATTALEAVRDQTSKAVVRVIGLWAGLRESLRELQQYAWTPEELEDTGRLLESVVEKGIRGLDRLKRATDLLRSINFEVKDAALLGKAMEEFVSTRDGILQNWPWPSRPIPAVDRNQLRLAAEERARGDAGEPIETLISRLSGEAATAD